MEGGERLGRESGPYYYGRGKEEIGGRRREGKGLAESMSNCFLRDWE